ncbi:MAG: OmpA family protein [Pseudomonadota bacterium]
MKKTLFATAAVVALSSGAALAGEGPYASFGAGYNQPEDESIPVTGATLSPEREVHYDSGFGVMGALGYDFGNSLRSEIELAHRDNDVSAIQTTANGAGDIAVTSLLANLIWEVDVESPVTPFLGVGVGGAHVDANYLATGATRAINVGDEDWALAYQGIVGLAWKVAENLAVDLSYRYFATDEVSFATAVPGGTLDQEYTAHGAFVGLRWAFGAPAPVVEPAAPVQQFSAPEPVETAEDLDLTVYFDFNKSNLTDAAEALIASAAETALENDIDRVVVEGHTDTSGSSAYNQVLSQRRAEAVRQGLIANGIPASAIEVTSFGENQPATATADGVREPLNRRAEVTIRFE